MSTRRSAPVDRPWGRRHVRPLLAGVAVVLVALACGAPAGPVRAPEFEEADAKTRRVAAKQARGVVEEIYESIRRGDTDGLSAIVSPTVTVIGPGVGQGFDDRADALVALGKVLGNGKHRVESQDLQVVASPAGKTAWAADRVDVDGERMHFVALLAGEDGLWSVTLIHLAPPLSSKDPDRAAGGAIDPPPGNTIAPGADGPAKAFAAVCATPEAALEQLGGTGDAVVVPGTRRSLAVGRKAIKKLWKKMLKEAPTWTPRGLPRVGLNADGSLAWAWAHVDVATDGPPLTHRVFAVYQSTGGVWDLVVLHPAVLSK